MPSHVIPKEQLTAYQRWELAAVEDLPPTQEQEGGDGIRPGLSFPTAEELERIQQSAWREGRELGMKEGREAGFAEGRRAGEAHVQRLSRLADAMEVERLLQDKVVAEEILNLALGIAQQVLRTRLAAKRGVVIEAMRQAFSSLPSLASHLRVVVNPADAEDVRAWLSNEHGHVACKVVEDAELGRGSFRFENDHSILHGELSARWREVVSCLGADQEWLE
jgi:flagellar assembly protein FliH